MTKPSSPSIQKAHTIHSKRRRLKVFLLVTGSLLLLGLMSWPSIHELLEEMETKSLPTVTMGSINIDKKLVTNPKIVGVDSNNQPYILAAASAEQQANDQVILTQVQGDITLRDKTQVHAHANKGRLSSIKPKEIYLYEGVNFIYDGVHSLRTTDVLIDFKKGILYGSNPIEGEGPNGVTSAQSFSFDYQKKILTLKGEASLTILEKG